MPTSSGSRWTGSPGNSYRQIIKRGASDLGDLAVKPGKYILHGDLYVTAMAYHTPWECGPGGQC